MLDQLPLETLSLILRIASIIIGCVLVYWECKSSILGAPTGQEAEENWEQQGIYSDMRQPWRIDQRPAGMLIPGYMLFIVLIVRPEPWILLGIGLIATAIFLKTNYIEVSSVLLVVALLRVAIFRLLDFAPNRHKFLVGNAVFQLIGEKGVLTKAVSPADTGLVRMEKPAFKNDVMECIADETIDAGEKVKVLEVDCGLLKVSRITKNA